MVDFRAVKPFGFSSRAFAENDYVKNHYLLVTGCSIPVVHALRVRKDWVRFPAARQLQFHVLSNRRRPSPAEGRACISDIKIRHNGGTGLFIPPMTSPKHEISAETNTRVLWHIKRMGIEQRLFLLMFPLM